MYSKLLQDLYIMRNACLTPIRNYHTRQSEDWSRISIGIPPVWWRGTVVERRSLAGELSLSCA